jgi:hypothetical protein
MRRKSLIGLVLLMMSAAPAYSRQPPREGQNPPTILKQSATQTPKTSPSTGKSSTAKTSLRNWKSYCSEEAEYCISYPPGWDVVGDVMGGTGVVMAPPQPGKDKSLWSEITVSVTDLPEPEKGKEPPSFDEIVSVALDGLPGNNVRMLQRSELTLHGRDAELIKVSYNDKETNRPWVEQIVFIDDELAIYSIALRATPDEVAGLEETFRRIVATWRPTESGPPGPAKPAAPQPPATKAPGAKTPPN